MLEKEKREKGLMKLWKIERKMVEDGQRRRNTRKDEHKMVEEKKWNEMNAENMKEIFKKEKKNKNETKRK